MYTLLADSSDRGYRYDAVVFDVFRTYSTINIAIK